ncbi:hypothetical protein JHL18_05070 [Clostridium sp. YIM B02505]|uniref:Uncharacterized protein n=1 Tax=Clostridium yunnanense TaxID=2800325 RepID=A0ABS1EKY2_9CLOT|nr:hypothetical protein [Clostridium yunnanense]MBK1810014.1 hypothetical protein [Clostridium yunnanense]
MRNNIKKIFSSRFWFILPVFSFFIRDNILSIIFWIIALIALSVAVSTNYESLINRSEIN